MSRLRFSAFTFVFLCAIARFSTGAPQLSDPAVLPGDAQPFAAVGTQDKPQIAAGADSFLAVWTDNRSALSGSGGVGGGGPYFGRGLGTMTDIYAARIGSDGAIVDQHPIVVSAGPYNQGYPRVSWNGENWLVAWFEEVEFDR